MNTLSRSIVAGAAGALMVVVLMGQAPSTGRMTIRDDGLEFPDGTVQTTAASTDPRRSFYVTSSHWDGASVFSACADGYHFASFWEIADVSTLRYATEVDDATQWNSFDQGPPTAIRGWVHTGYPGSVGNAAGIATCNIWNSNDPDHYGTTIRLEELWGDAQPSHPWSPDTETCDKTISVWCVQD